MATQSNAGTESTKRELLITRTFDAPRELVFKAWTDPQHLIRWWGPRGYTTPLCEMDLRPGGAYRFRMRSSEGNEVLWHGMVREIVAPERIVWTCRIDHADGTPISSETTLTITLKDEQGKTHLTLHQGIFDSDENCAAHQSGWSDALDRMAEHFAATQSK
jgi:uncharacterized protein YndB with AHSA1/START domain